MCDTWPPYLFSHQWLLWAACAPGGYSHTLPIRVCAAHWGRDFEAPDLERGIHFISVSRTGYNISNARKLQFCKQPFEIIQGQIAFKNTVQCVNKQTVVLLLHPRTEYKKLADF